LSDKIRGADAGPPAPPVILASASTARHALLQGAGIPAEAIAAHIDEDEIKRAFREQPVDDTHPGGSDAGERARATEAALMLAETKALRISARHPGALVIGADQILLCGVTWFDKPEDIAAAREQLRVLSGQTHVLVTATVVVRDGIRIWQHVAVPRLTMRELSDSFIDNYLAEEGDAALGSVGAYRLEGRGVQMFTRIDGDYFTILGLPLLALLGFLREHLVVAS
jgi:septum formation protein